MVEMEAHEITAKTILRKAKRLDSWFVSRYGMNLYRGCSHDCAYCDGRAEKYQVEGTFGRRVEVKTNALELLERELDPARRRKPLTRCYFTVGGGVNDSYQPIERRYRLTRGALRLLLRFGYPALVLTKSPFVAEDLDLIKEIHEKSGAILGVSLSGVDPRTSRVFEPTAASPAKRLETIALFKANGIPCVIFLMPVIPFVTDAREQMENSLRAAKEAGADYVVFGGLTLKEGRQSEHFMRVLADYDASLLPRYQKLYADSDQWGGASADYYDALHREFDAAARAARIPVRMPRRLYQSIIAPDDVAIVTLEHLDYLLRLRGATSPYAYAANSLRSTGEPIAAIRDHLREMRGIGPAVAELIGEILDTGTCRLYEKLADDYR